MADSGKNQNGMRAQNWKPADTSAFKQYSVKSKKDNAELFESIRGLVTEAVKQLRGDASDDKYRYIVDMIMLRMRGLLNEVGDDSDEELTDYIDEVVNNNLVAYIDGEIAKVKTQQGSSSASAQTFDSKQLGEFADGLLEKLEDWIEDELEDRESEQDVSADGYEKPEIAVSTASVSSAAAEEVSKKLGKIEKLCGKITSDSGQQTASISNFSAAKASLDVKQTPKVAASDIQIQKQKDEKKQKKKDAAKIKIVTENFQEQFDKLQTKTNGVSKQYKDANEEINEQLDIIEKNTSNGIGLGTVLIGVGILAGLLAVVFWDKIKAWWKGFSFWGKIVKWLESFEIVKKIEEWWKNLDIAGWFGNLWDKYIYPFIWDQLGNLGNTILSWAKATITGFLGNSTKFVVDKFTQAYNALVGWKNDVWSWITGKQKKMETDHKKQEEEGQNRVIGEIDKNLNAVNGTITNGQKQTEKIVQEQNKKIDSHLNKTVADAEKQTAEMQSKLDDDITRTQQESEQQANETNAAITQVQETAENQINDISEKQLPQMEKDVEEGSNSEISKLDQKFSDKIKNAEGEADKELKAMEEKSKQDGAATTVSKDALTKLDSQADGGKLDVTVDQPAQVPASTAGEKLEDKGVTMYSDKKQLEEGKKNVAEANKISGSVYSAAGSNNPASKIVANIKGTVDVKSESPELKEAVDKQFEDLNKGQKTIIDSFTENKKTLDGLNGLVDKYFGNLNELIASCRSAFSSRNAAPPAGAQTVPVVISQGGGNSLLADNK